MAETETKFYELVHPGGPKGLVTREPAMREQDETAKEIDGYAVVFFPKLDVLGPAKIWFRDIQETFSQTPEAAKAKYMDGIKLGETWETYEDAGHRLRKVRVVDLGDG